MLSSNVLARLRDLNRSRRAPEPLRYESAPRSRPDAHALPEGRECGTDFGSHWQIRTPIDRLWPGASRFIAGKAPLLSELASHAASEPGELASFARHFPRGTMYLDLETCGFAGSMIFLVGLIHADGAELVLTQLLARNYAEERSILASMWRTAAENRVLVTFNGKSFDWPSVHDRSTVYRLGRRVVSGRAAEEFRPVRLPADERPEPAHCDLLPIARRRWRRRLPNCRLQTLEQAICGRRRTGDIAGRDIPAAYHDYVRTGQTASLASILHHNALDLVTLLQISLAAVQASVNEKAAAL